MYTQTIDPKRLDPEARDALADELFVTHSEVFSGVDRDAFAAYVVGSKATSTDLLVLRDDSGRARGYCAVHAFVQTHLGRRTLVIRAEIAAEKAWRRRSFAGPFMVRVITRLTLRYAGLPKYIFACFVHPSAYVSLGRHTPEIWPRPDRETPPRMQALMHSLARQFDIEVRDGIAEVGWIANADPAPRRLDPLASYYLERNPGYVRGQGLLTVMPIRGLGLIRGVADYCAHRMRRQRSSVGERVMPEPAVQSAP